MFAATFVAVLVVVIFAWDIGQRWWRETAWRRRWRRKDDDR